MRVMYARGQFEQKVLPEIRGQAVATLEYSFRPGEGGPDRWSPPPASGFVQVDNRVLNTLGKVAAPIVQAKADKEVGLSAQDVRAGDPGRSRRIPRRSISS